MAANKGNDADTTAAIYGQLAGAYYGSENGLPGEWLAKLHKRELLVRYASGIHEMAHVRVTPKSDGSDPL